MDLMPLWGVLIAVWIAGVALWNWDPISARLLVGFGVVIFIGLGICQMFK